MGFFKNSRFFHIKPLKIACVSALLLSVFITALWGAGKIAEGRNVATAKGNEFVVSVWQIDTFSGGVGSRRQFLSNRAREFSKSNKNALFLVTSHTKQSAEENFKNGVFPDIISFGCGVSVPSAVKLSDEFYFEGGSLGKNPYATPWCRGGYFLIKSASVPETENEKKFSSVIVSKGEYNLSLFSAFTEGYEIERVVELPSADAFKTFTLGKIDYMIGTQREIAMLKNRGVSFTSTPLTGFCDLYQYLSVTSMSQEKIAVAEDFIRFLLSDSSQSKLSDIFMIPVKPCAAVNVDLKDAYGKGVKKVLSAFVPESSIKDAGQKLTAYFSGDKSLYNKINSYLNGSF